MIQQENGSALLLEQGGQLLLNALPAGGVMQLAIVVVLTCDSVAQKDQIVAETAANPLVRNVSVNGLVVSLVFDGDQTSS